MISDELNMVEIQALLHLVDAPLNGWSGEPFKDVDEDSTLGKWLEVNEEEDLLKRLVRKLENAGVQRVAKGEKP